MRRRIINIAILFLILIISLYPLWFFIIKNANEINITKPPDSSIAKEFDELEKDNKYQEWNYFDAYLDKYNPFISFDNQNVILEEDLITNEYDYYYIDSFNDLNEFEQVFICSKDEYCLKYYGDLTNKFIFFDTTKEVTIHYQNQVINHSVILNNNLASAKGINLIYQKNLVITNSIIPNVKLAEGNKKTQVYLINSLLNYEFPSGEFYYKIINCPYVGINEKEPQYISYQDSILNSVI